jgi:dsRNA-specific ribonuclease
LVEEEGPPHRKTFTVEVRLHRASKRGRAEYVARAKGGTKKMAEQNAARDALAYLHNASNGNKATNLQNKAVKPQATKGAGQ